MTARNSTRDTGITRRDVLKWMVTGAFALLGCTSYLTYRAFHERKTPRPAGGLIEMRTLGRTGLKVSSLGMGDFAERDLYTHGRRLGLNLIETARAYDFGNSEANIGKVIKKIGRENIVLLTKFTPTPDCSYDRIMESVNKSLQTLGVSSIDILLGHGVDDLAVLSHANMIRAFSELRKSGKARFSGVSTHSARPVLDWILKNGGYDVVLLPFHFGMAGEITDLITKAHKSGIGILGMKSAFLNFRKGADIRRCSLDALRYAMGQSFIDSVLVRIGSYEELDEVIEALRKPLDDTELQSLKEAVIGPKLKEYRPF